MEPLEEKQEDRIVITSAEGIMEPHDGWERPPTPEMMEVHYSKFDGWSGKQIEDHLAEEVRSRDPNTVREEQIEQLEGLMTGLDFWPQAVEVFGHQQSLLAQEINYTGRHVKHERRNLEAILKECHRDITSGIRESGGTKRDRVREIE